MWERILSREQKPYNKGRSAKIEDCSPSQLHALVVARLTYTREVIRVDQVGDVIRLVRQNTEHLEIKRVLKTIPYILHPRELMNDPLLLPLLHENSCVYAAQDAALQNIEAVLEACKRYSHATNISQFRIQISREYIELEQAFDAMYANYKNSPQQRIDRWTQSNGFIYLTPGVDTVLPRVCSSEEKILYETSADITRAMVQAKGKVTTIGTIWKKICSIESQHGTVLTAFKVLCAPCTPAVYMASPPHEKFTVRSARNSYDVMKNCNYSSTDSILDVVCPDNVELQHDDDDIISMGVNYHVGNDKLSVQISPAWCCMLFPYLGNYNAS